ncbi:MAG: phosphotransferase [Clostridia bacterium]|nr:phosphotransferase [Clostridia bacterium]
MDIDLIGDNYGIDIEKIELLDSHFGTDIYKADGASGKYIVKACPVYERYSEGSRREGEITNYLYKKGIKVARLLPTSAGTFHLDNEDKFITVQKFIDGKGFGVVSAPERVIDAMARLLADLHNALAEYPGLPVFFGEDFFRSNNVKRRLAYYKEDMNGAEGDVKEKYIEQINHCERIASFGIDTTKLTYRNSHGDYYIGQVIASDDGITLIDFASASKMPVVLELATSFILSSPKCRGGVIPADDFKKYIDRYAARCPLTEYDVKMIPFVFYFWQTMCNYHPRDNVADNYKDIAEHIRNTLMWLHGNVEELSEELVK